MKCNFAIIAIAVVFFVGQGFAQIKQVRFFSKTGREVKTSDSAYFIQTITWPVEGQTLYEVKEEYSNGALKLVGKTYTVDQLKLEGLSKTYYPSGILKEENNYKNNRLFEDVKSYYPNGKLYTQKKYLQSKDPNAPEYLIISFKDSTEKPMVVNGDGYYIHYIDDFKKIKEEGPVKDGLKNGSWKGNNDDAKDYVTYTEKYVNGKFISGESRDETGKTYRYTDESPPEYIGGYTEFSKYLSQNIKYPEKAKKNNIVGKVFVQFIVDKDGSLKDVKVLRSPDLELSEEAKRVVQLSPKWKPGMQYGRTVRVEYVVPINFDLK